MTKTYSSRSTAKRALKNVLAKMGMDIETSILSYEIDQDGDKEFAIVVSFPEVPSGDLAQLNEIATIVIDTGEDEPEVTIEVEGDSYIIPSKADEAEFETDEARDPQLDRELDEAVDADQPKRKHGYIREISAAVKPTQLVHQIADSMPDASRKEVIAECRRRGIAFGTARTQYQKWFSARK